MTKWLAPVLKITLSVGLIWYVLRRIDFSSAWTTLLSIPLASLVAGMALLLAQLIPSAYRLKELLRALGQSCRLRVLLDVAWTGAFFSQTPISFVGGDAMRVWRLTRFRIPAASATQAVVLDRLAGFAGIVAIVLLTIPFLLPLFDGTEIQLWLVLMASTVLGFVFAVFLVRRLLERFARQRILAAIVILTSQGLYIARSGRRAIHILGLSILVQLANVLALFVLARGLSMNVGLGVFILLVPMVLFVSMLPISIAGWGVREGAMVGALALVGVPAHQSLALSICYGLSLVLISLPGGLIWFISRRPPDSENVDGQPRTLGIGR